VEAVRRRGTPSFRHDHHDDEHRDTATSSSAGSAARSTGSSTRSPSSTDAKGPVVAAVLEPQAHLLLRRWRRIGHYQGSNNRMSRATRTGSARAMRSRGRRHEDGHPLQPGPRGETALMVKSRFVTEYDDPQYTSASWVRRRDPAVRLRRTIRVCSTVRSAVLLPGHVTQVIHVGDCELLER